MNNEKYDIVQQAVDAINNTAIPQGPSESLIRQTLETIADETPEPKPNFILERIRKMKPIGKVAAAAIIIVGISAALLFNSSAGSIALADVYTRVQQVQGFMYKMSVTMNGQMTDMMPPGRTKMDVTVTVSSQYGMKMDNTTQVIEQNETMHQLIYLLPDEKKILSVMPTQKMYQTIEFSDDICEKMKQENCDPRETIKQMLACEYTDLGRSEIDGVTVQGFETSDPAYSGGVFSDHNGNGTATLWVDVDTWLPVRSEMNFIIEPLGVEFSAVISDFQWNIPLQAGDFEPVIPDDYRSMGKMKMPKITEEAAIEGLRFYADAFGYYPKKLELMELIQDASQKISSNVDFIERVAKKQEDDDRAAEELMSEIMQEFLAPIQSMGLYYMTLVQEKKDPAYFGSQVSPEDKDMVLLRWKLEGDTYRVVFGDLTVTEMTYDELVEIEPDSSDEPSVIPEGAAVSAALSDAQLKVNYESMKNIKQMVMACWQYSQKNNGQWPDNLQDLGLSAEIYVNPRQPDNPDSYVYLKPGDPSTRTTPANETVVIYETYEDWGIGINVGFFDGHVEFIRDEARFLNLMGQ